MRNGETKRLRKRLTNGTKRNISARIPHQSKIKIFDSFPPGEALCAAALSANTTRPAVTLRALLQEKEEMKNEKEIYLSLS